MTFGRKAVSTSQNALLRVISSIQLHCEKKYERIKEKAKRSFFVSERRKRD
jgi:hypothetical protein